MKLALDKKDSDLAAAQKAAQDNTALVDKKLASIRTLEGEVNKLKSCLNEANREVTSLKKDKVVLNEKLESVIRKRNDTKAYLRTLAKKLYLVLEGISFNPTVLMLAIGSSRLMDWLLAAELCQDFDEETGRVETGLDPIASPVCDETAMNVLRLESRIASTTSNHAHLKEVVT